MIIIIDKAVESLNGVARKERFQQDEANGLMEYGFFSPQRSREQGLLTLPYAGTPTRATQPNPTSSGEAKT